VDTEKLHPVDAVVSHPELPEVISPELVLVDPELARIARLLLPEPPPVLAPRREPAPAQPLAAERTYALPLPQAPPSPVRRARKPFHQVATQAIPALAVGAVVLGMIASEVRIQLLADPTSLAAPTPSNATRVQAPAPSRADPVVPLPAPTAPETTEKTPVPAPAAAPPVRPAPAKSKPAPAPAPATPRTASPAPATSKPTPTPAPAPSPKKSVASPAAQPPAVTQPAAVEWVPKKSEVEVRALEFLNRRVPLVPAGLVDEDTGLLVTNVHVSCQRVGGPTLRFTCSVGSGAFPQELWRLTVVPSRDGPWRWQTNG
jgi:hypothetical protein